jgi:CRP/FNR family transcriptional regulator, cyclic AMP receptor protein
MPRATFMALLDESVAFNRFLLIQLNERLGQFIGLVEHDRLRGPDARLARGLASLFNPYLYPGSRSTLPISQEELGQLVGLSRQRVNQALQVLEQKGLLRVEYGGVTVLDLKGLRDFDD